MNEPCLLCDGLECECADELIAVWDRGAPPPGFPSWEAAQRWVTELFARREGRAGFPS